jgi:DNA ligase (NAD+)
MNSLTPTQIAEAGKLVSDIRKWKAAYYNGTALVIDQVYDGAEMRLKQLIPDHPVLSEVGAPSSDFETIDYVARGASPMMSLDKVYSIKEVESFVAGRQYVPMAKLDGMSLRAEFEDGKLVLAHTRGNKTVGDVVTSNFYFVNGAFPTKFPKAPKFAVRGEVVMTSKDFEDLNKLREAKGEDLFSNPRNAAAGSMKNKDFMITAGRKLSFLAYILEIPGFTFKTKMDMLLALEEMGYKTPRIKSATALKSIKDCIEETTRVRDQMPVAIDGLVFELNDVSLQEQLGCTGHHPKWAMAYKFANDSGKTCLTRKEWEVSRTRRVVPVGIIEPLELAGAVCTKVTLNNAKWVRDYRIADGEELVIERAGDVIPHFVEMVRETKDITSDLGIPTTCPSCQTPLVESGVDLLCPNLQCCGAAVKVIKHYVSKPVVNIDGVGEKLVEQLVENGYIKTAADIYTLTKPQLLRLEKFGDRKADNVLESIQKAKTQTKIVFLLSLGIDGLGKDVAAKIVDMVDLDTLTVNGDLCSVDGISDITANAVLSGLGESTNFVAELRKHVTIQDVKKAVVSNVLNDKSFCVSGSVIFEFNGKKYIEREEVQDLIRAYGGRVVTGVSKKVNILVAGPGSGSKSDKAREYGIPIISGDDLVKMIS